MKINITAGEELNKIMKRKFPDERFIPFNEAMIRGTYTAPLFSDEFIRQRAEVHGVTEEYYREHFAEFLEFLENIDDYDCVVLWFGDEPFCQANLKVAGETLEMKGYSGELIVKLVDEYTGEELKK